MRLVSLGTHQGAESDHGLGAVARLIASGQATTRPEIARATGLARSTIGSHLKVLLDADVIREAGLGDPTGRGRPAQRLLIAPTAGVILVAALTPRHAEMAVIRLSQEVVAKLRVRLDIGIGPKPVLAAVRSHFAKMLSKHLLDTSEVKCVVISLPGPVDVRRGVPVRPPIMPGWDEYPVAETMSRHFACPTLVDNDANLMALGEARALPKDQCPLLFVKIGTGIGGGIVTATGELHHGADGAACDIGHIRVAGAEEVICSCGNVGCVEALASAEAITQALRTAKDDSHLTQVDLERLVRLGDPVATRLVRNAAAILGEVVAMLVHFYNPARVVIGGALTLASDDMLAGVRSVVYQQALPLATRNLTLAQSILGPTSGITGGMVLGIEHVLSATGAAKMGSPNSSVGHFEVGRPGSVKQ